MSREPIGNPTIKPDNKADNSDASWTPEKQESFRQLVEFLSMQFLALPGSLSLAIEGKVPAFTLEYAHSMIRGMDEEVQKRLTSWGMRSRYIPTLFQELTRKIDQLYSDKASPSTVKKQIDASMDEITTELFNFIKERTQQSSD